MQKLHDFRIQNDSENRILSETQSFGKKSLKKFKKAQKRSHRNKDDPELHLFWKDDLETLYKEQSLSIGILEEMVKKIIIF